jgi:hypothetical protein
MDFRFDAEERGILAEAGASFRRWLPPERLLPRDDHQHASWASLANDGWLDVDAGDEGLPLPLIAGVGREAGRVGAGDAFVSNALLIRGAASSDGAEALPPGFLIADGTDSTHPATGEERPWSFGVEKSLVPYVLEPSGALWRFASTDWSLEPVSPLAPQVVTAARVGDADGTKVGTALADGVAVLTRARIVHAATLVGLGETMTSDAVTYAKQRVQFGDPIGRFQAVKHLLAESAVALEIAWNATLYAAVRPDEGAADIAQIQAQRAVDLSSRIATQVFGGIGITWEHHLHVLVKCAQTSRMRFGGADRIAARVGARLIKEDNLS